MVPGYVIRGSKSAEKNDKGDQRDDVSVGWRERGFRLRCGTISVWDGDQMDSDKAY